MALYMHRVTGSDPCIQDTRYPEEARNQDEVLFPTLPLFASRVTASGCDVPGGIY